jgi:hypothetical protein
MLTPKSATRLDLLRAKTEAQSDSEVVREALKFYEQLIEDSHKGKQFVVRDKATGGEEVIRIF